MKVKVLGIDGDRVRLSRKAVLADEMGQPVKSGPTDRPGRPDRSNHRKRYSRHRS
jgi:polyribonucleotide nucleotidyltransferase